MVNRLTGLSCRGTKKLSTDVSFRPVAVTWRREQGGMWEAGSECGSGLGGESEETEAGCLGGRGGRLGCGWRGLWLGWSDSRTHLGKS